MKLDLTGRQIEITEGIQEFVERKIFLYYNLNN